MPESKSTGKEFVVSADGFHNVQISALRERCGFWRDSAKDVPF